MLPPHAIERSDDEGILVQHNGGIQKTSGQCFSTYSTGDQCAELSFFCFVLSCKQAEVADDYISNSN